MANTLANTLANRVAYTTSRVGLIRVDAAIVAWLGQTETMTLSQLLIVQGHDSAVDRLRHQRATLPQREAIANCDEEIAHVESRLNEITAQRSLLERDQKRHEDEVALIEDRRTNESERLYSGAVTAHKDLQAIQAELEVLATRQSSMEDEVLLVMESIEPLDAQLEKVNAQADSIRTRRAHLVDELTAAEAAVDAEIESEQQQRSQAIGDVAPELCETYERVRADLGGVGVARLEGKTCAGCRLGLAAVALDRIRKEPADAVVFCPECERILVRD